MKLTNHEINNEYKMFQENVGKMFETSDVRELFFLNDLASKRLSRIYDYNLKRLLFPESEE